ncbi:MAG: tetratricopeptide repeat protein [Bacteroidetes bacterium]|nr:tetratricopeptide repeat protein [Bacteroidota bacterium]
MKKTGLIFMWLCVFGPGVAYSSQDSLYQVWKDETQHDTTRFKAIKSFIWGNYLFSRPDTACVIAHEQLDYAVKRRNLLKQADAYNTIGISWYFRSEFDSALVYYEKGLDCVRRSGMYRAASAFLNNMGTIEMARGNYAVAIEKFNQGLKIEELKRDTLSAANCHLNIGIVYYRQGEYDRAREYYLLADALYLKIGSEPNRGNVLNNLGVMENELKNSLLAISYHEEAFAIRQKNNDQVGMGASLNNLATTYMDMRDFEKALPYFSEALKIAEATQDMVSVSAVKFNMANIYLDQGKLDESIRMATEAYEIATTVGAISERKQAAELLYTAYKKKADYKQSLEMHETFMHLKDSITSDENKSAIIRQEYKAEYEKMAVADSLKSVEEKKLQKAELATERAENHRREQFSIFLVIGLLAAVVFGFIIYKRLRITREQKAIIEEQKITVTHAFDQLEEKNKEILDSITYAKRIQSAILPSRKFVSQVLADAFILYQPKDIVAGDFYWIESYAGASDSEGKKYAGASDSKGKKYAGALDSVGKNATDASDSKGKNNAGASDSGGENELGALDSEGENAVGASDSKGKKNAGASDSEGKKYAGASDSEGKNYAGALDSVGKNATDASDSEGKKNAGVSDSGGENAVGASDSKGKNAVGVSDSGEENELGTLDSKGKNYAGASDSKGKNYAGALDSVGKKNAGVSDSGGENLVAVSASDGKADCVLFAAADCTGHGVPGALVSVVCHNALNRSVREYGLTDPAKILDKTREIVVHEFEKSDENVRDGMDISLCALSLSSLTLAWAGANNPLWVVRKSTGALEELKGDKQPIGKFADAKPFTGHQLQLEKGDTIYVFTDGFQDQFGGDKGKKFKASSLKELILEVTALPMPEQLHKIQHAFEDWRGSLEQVDDVCLIGVRV